MPEVSLAGQQKLKAARVLCVGTGGLGSPVTLYLAAAGVGTLGLVDFDTVDLSNIQRQILYATADVGRPKLDAAAQRLHQLNPHIRIEPHAVRVSSETVIDIARGYDIIVDGTDNFPTRYLVNDACVLLGKPLVYGSIFRFEGQISVFDARQGPCYRCLFPEPPPPGAVPSCAEGGVLGVLPGIIGCLQALEAIKLILGSGQPLIGRLVLFDALSFEFHEVRYKKDQSCAACGSSPTITAPIDCETLCATADTPTVLNESTPDTLSVEEYAAMRAAGSDLELIDVRTAQEYEIARIPEATLIPISELADRLARLDKAKTYVLTCHHGARSVQAYQLMRDAGFRHLRVLAGGVDAWAQRIDLSLPRY